jgi:eukaryotic-like serine/threonine-protein kinase
MPLKFSKRRIGLLTLAVISLFSWGGLAWFIHVFSASTRIFVETETPVARNTFEASTSLLTSIPMPTSIPKIGSTTTGRDGAILVYVPEGEFVMGSDVNADEQPIHTIQLDAFWIDQIEVTNKLFSTFADATGYKTDAEITGWAYTWDGLNWAQILGADWRHPGGESSNILGKEKHPVTQISWNDAAAYCEWAGKRLPTEAEWEKAARGTDQRAYPWGNELPNADLLNFLNNIGNTTEAGSYPNGTSPYGAYDMSGNVWEWVNDRYQSNYYASLKENFFNPQGPLNGKGKVLRGGSWVNYYDAVRSADRRWSNPLFAFSNYGFRCALSYP